MKLELHTISGAPRGWRVLVGLALKGLEYEVNYLQASKGEHKSSQFLAINSRGTIPVLRSGDILLRDSIAILAWLDRQYPDKPLFGKSASDAAKIWQITLECCDYLREAAHQLLTPVLVTKEIPSFHSEDGKRLIEAGVKAHAECQFLENLLKNQHYLAGDAPSAADAIAYPEIKLIERAIKTQHETMDRLGFSHLPDLYPRMIDWKNRMNQLPGMENTLPIHW